MCRSLLSLPRVPSKSENRRTSSTTLLSQVDGQRERLESVAESAGSGFLEVGGVVGHLDVGHTAAMEAEDAEPLMRFQRQQMRGWQIADGTTTTTMMMMMMSYFILIILYLLITAASPYN